MYLTNWTNIFTFLQETEKCIIVSRFWNSQNIFIVVNIQNLQQVLHLYISFFMVA